MVSDESGGKAGAGPLSHLKVIDLSRVRSGPTAVRQLGDWGAHVIRIDTPGGEHDEVAGPRHGPDFQNLHRNKKSLTLNLKDPEALAIFKRLVEESDVLVENFRPDVKRRLGIDYETLRQINPRLVYASISGFGQDGPYRDRPGFDQVAQGMGGLMSVTGLPGQGPVRAGTAVADLGAGIFCALGIFIALLERERSGEGQWVQSNLLAAQISLLDFQAARWLISGKVPDQAGNDHPMVPLMGVYPTADGHLNIAAGGERMWRNLCAALEAPELMENPLFAGSDELRLTNREALTEEVRARMKSRTTAEWIDILLKHDVPCGPIYRIDEVFDDPQVRHLGLAQPIPHPKLGTVSVVGQPVTLSRTPSKLWGSAPEHGEHTDEVLAALGVEPSAIEAMRKRGAI